MSDESQNRIEQEKLDKARQQLAMAVEKMEYGSEYVVGLHVKAAYNALGGSEDCHVPE